MLALCEGLNVLQSLSWCAIPFSFLVNSNLPLGYNTSPALTLSLGTLWLLNAAWRQLGPCLLLTVPSDSCLCLPSSWATIAQTRRTHQNIGMSPLLTSNDSKFYLTYTYLLLYSWLHRITQSWPWNFHSPYCASGYHLLFAPLWCNPALHPMLILLSQRAPCQWPLLTSPTSRFLSHIALFWRWDCITTFKLQTFTIRQEMKLCNKNQGLSTMNWIWQPLLRAKLFFSCLLSFLHQVQSLSLHILFVAATLYFSLCSAHSWIPSGSGCSQCFQDFPLMLPTKNKCIILRNTASFNKELEKINIHENNYPSF